MVHDTTDIFLVAIIAWVCSVSRKPARISNSWIVVFYFIVRLQTILTMQFVDWLSCVPTFFKATIFNVITICCFLFNRTKMSVILHIMACKMICFFCVSSVFSSTCVIVSHIEGTRFGFWFYRLSWENSRFVFVYYYYYCKYVTYRCWSHNK